MVHAVLQPMIGGCWDSGTISVAESSDVWTCAVSIVVTAAAPALGTLFPQASALSAAHRPGGRPVDGPAQRLRPAPGLRRDPVGAGGARRWSLSAWCSAAQGTAGEELPVANDPFCRLPAPLRACSTPGFPGQRLAWVRARARASASGFTVSKDRLLRSPTLTRSPARMAGRRAPDGHRHPGSTSARVQGQGGRHRPSKPTSPCSSLDRQRPARGEDRHPDQARVGEWVVAMGRPSASTTRSPPASFGQARRLPDETYVPFIQTDVAINLGNLAVRCSTSPARWSASTA